MRIAVLDDYQDYARHAADWSKVEARAQVVFFRRAFASADALVRALADFDVLCLMRERTAFPRAVLARLPKLKHIVLTGRRSQTLDIDALPDLGISIRTTGGGAAALATPELALGLMLALARNIPLGDRLMRQGDWLENAPLGTVLHGKTLGIIGLGTIGTRLAELAAALGMGVIAWSPNLTADRAAAASVGFRSDKQALLRDADVVSLHLVLAESTTGILGAGDLAAMKRTAFLINTARGPLVDEAALIAALHNGLIAGAAIDVYEREPLPADHPLRTAPNCILLPHFGYVVREVYDPFYRETVAALEDLLAAT